MMTYNDIVRVIKADFDTGQLFWRERTPDVFNETAARTTEASCNIWNGHFAGKEALTAVNRGGYRCGRIFNRPVIAHRVMWLLHKGAWPSETIDHINGDRLDNRIMNLRAVSSAENLRNLRMRSANTSGVMGVSWSKHSGKWLAQIRVVGMNKHLGYFTDIADAAAARKAAESVYGYHINHGRAA